MLKWLKKLIKARKERKNTLDVKELLRRMLNGEELTEDERNALVAYANESSEGSNGTDNQEGSNTDEESNNGQEDNSEEGSNNPTEDDLNEDNQKESDDDFGEDENPNNEDNPENHTDEQENNEVIPPTTDPVIPAQPVVDNTLLQQIQEVVASLKNEVAEVRKLVIENTKKKVEITDEEVKPSASKIGKNFFDFD